MSLNFYESVLALNPSTEEDLQNQFFGDIQKTLKNFSGSVHHVDSLGSRKLPNTGKKKPFKRALYFYFSYKALPQAVFEVERLCRIRDFILYFHSEKLDSRISLDEHQNKFEDLLKESLEREEARKSRILAKRKKTSGEDPSKKRS